MKRRAAVKGIILFSLGTGIIYSCTDKYKAIRDLNLDHFAPIDEELNMIETLSNIIVPLSSIPELVDHSSLPFIFTMLDDIYAPADRRIFLEGYKTFDEYVEKSEGLKFTQMKIEQQSLYVARLNNQEAAVDSSILSFFNIVKAESIAYLKTSEYYQRKVNYYEMAPGRFIGEVSINDLKNVNEA